MLKLLEGKEFIPYGTDPEMDKKVDSPDSYVRAAVAKQGYGLDKLIDDPDEDVRWEVANQGYGLDKLVDDPKSNVRYEVAEHGYGLDKLINDPDPYVKSVARRKQKLGAKKKSTRRKNTYSSNIDYTKNISVGDLGFSLDVENDPDAPYVVANFDLGKTGSTSYLDCDTYEEADEIAKEIYTYAQSIAPNYEVGEERNFIDDIFSEFDYDFIDD